VTVQHAVLLRFDPELDADAEQDMFGQVRAWPDTIGGFEVLRIGRPAATTRTRGYHFLLFMEFPDEAALDAYQVHPVHRRFAAWVVEHGGTVLAFDYALDQTTVLVPEPARGHDAGRTPA
jgi:Stress responsive A/B Barrel Domain